MKKIIVIGTVGLPACYGGFESLVENLTNNASKKFSYTVFCSSKTYENKMESYNGANLEYIPLNANGIQSIAYDILSLFKSFFLKPDVILILGVSGCIFLPFYRFFSKSKIITNIDGLEWKRDKWNPLAKAFLKFSEKLAVKFSDVVICDNEAISDYVYKEYKKSNEVIAYGGDHVLLNNSLDYGKGDYYFSVCRIEPENNVEMILKAFANLEEKVKFVGNWEASSYGQRLKSEYSKYENIKIIDPIYDLSVLYTLRSECKGYLHGHSAGGTNPSLVEAMHFCIPIFAYDCNFNRFSTEDKAMFFNSSEALVKLIKREKPEHIGQCARNMKEVAERRYTWKVITSAYEQLY